MKTQITERPLILEINEDSPENEDSGAEPKQRSTERPYLVSTTTGGVENSCHSCMLAFGMVAFIIGVSTSSLAYATNSVGSVLFTLGITVLFMGIAFVSFSCAWRYHRKKRKEKMKEDLAELFYEYQRKKFRV
uniref:Transmembrane protein 100 n=1 Tax=Xenopus tropicalis TaxID=8364 RepID=A0A6I8SJI2_XENTR